jgi:hypothetical protein
MVQASVFLCKSGLVVAKNLFKIVVVYICLHTLFVLYYSQNEHC